MASHISFEIYKQLRTLVLKNINIISIPVYIKYFGTKFSMSAKDFFNLRKDIIQQLQLRENMDTLSAKIYMTNTITLLLTH